ncbi:sensor histidine kinase [Hydrocoleum sp. CS-953]|uniref:sensor histidine kinase n=1 Tax=Hydrocoleum sp. CS-953 TaxID=1671698 RepID=UPI002110B369|nr:HAMP domain-containing sensor histidine kinase [Hydrocoleum sp. CS-953]
MAQKNNLIKITTEVNENNIIISNFDNGIGMSQETLQQAFDYLFTTKPVGKGTGLGLSICRQIIEGKHNGKLLCNSEIGKGSTFIIEIPN